MSHKDFLLPKMGESITEGTIIEWHVQEGDHFEEGDVLLEVATDKVDNEVPAPYAGILISQEYKAGDVVAIGSVIAKIHAEEGEAGAATQAKAKETKEKPSVPARKKPPTKQVSSAAQNFVVNSNVFISPLVDSIARAQYISYEELARIPGSGKDGRLRKSDLMTYISEGRPYKFAQPQVANNGFQVPDLKFDKGKGRIIEMDRMRQMIADHMVYSKHTSPHVTAYVEADLTNMVTWRNAHKESFQEKYGERLTFTPLFIEAVAKAIKDFPNINASVDGKNIIVKDDINVGMATALPSGNLIVPVVRDAAQKDLKTLASEVNALAAKARENKLSGDDIKGSTFTISNVGTFGSVMGTPIINQPEVAILALGIIKKRAEVLETEEGDEIAVRSMMYLSLSFDHRVVDGYLGGSFVRRVADYFENFDLNRTI